MGAGVRGRELRGGYKEKFSAVLGGGSFLLPTRKNNSPGKAVFA